MRCDVLYIERSMYEGVDPDCPWPSFRGRTSHRSFLTADFSRRFRTAHQGPGWSSQTQTAIVEPGSTWSRDAPGDLDTVMDPRYLKFVERFVWNPLYWLRNRWDGIRYGLDRDRKS